VGTVFLFRRAVFRPWIDILQGKVERITIILTRDFDQWEQAGHSEGGAQCIWNSGSGNRTPYSSGILEPFGKRENLAR
jgi:hypothetical protein